MSAPPQAPSASDAATMPAPPSAKAAHPDFALALNYTSLNEDWRAEQRALRVGPGDRVLCLTGGSRSLVLLEHGPELMLSIDMSPAQTYLLELQRAAMRELDRTRFVAFLGLTPAPDRVDTLRRLAPALTPEARAFWLARERVVRRGVLYSGRFERYHRKLARIARLLRGRAVRDLFACRTLEEQREFVRSRWDRGWWRRVVRFLSSPRLARIAYGDPAFYAHVDPGISVGDLFYDRMQRMLETDLARDHFMLSFVLRGHLPESDLPPHLASASYERVRANLDRLCLETGEVAGFLESGPAGRFTRFSLSDSPSYLDPAGFERLLRAMIHAAAPGARFCVRQFLTDYPVPAALASSLAREPELEARLEAEDRAFAFRFMVGTVRT